MWYINCIFFSFFGVGGMSSSQPPFIFPPPPLFFLFIPPPPPPPPVLISQCGVCLCLLSSRLAVPLCSCQCGICLCWLAIRLCSCLPVSWLFGYVLVCLSLGYSVMFLSTCLSPSPRLSQETPSLSLTISLTCFLPPPSPPSLSLTF